MGEAAPLARRRGTASAHAGTGRRGWRFTARRAAGLSLAALLVPVVVRWTGWEVGPLAIVVSFMPWFAVASAVPLALALAARSRVLIAATAAVSLLCVAWVAPLYSGDSADGEPVLSVATVNLLYGQADADAVVRMVAEYHIDLIAVQELTPDAVVGLRAAGLEELLPFSQVLAESGAGGVGLWSRVEFEDAAEVGGMTFSAGRADVTVGDARLALLVVHPAAPGPMEHERWGQDMDRLAKILGEETGAVMVAGDFNTTRDHRAFRDLEAMGYVDAADQADSGFGPTFPQGRLPMPVVVIDHVLARDAGLVAIESLTVVIPGTDHRALIAIYADA